MTLIAPPVSTARIAQELEQARRSGPLRQIAIPPCPTLLLRLRDTLAPREPDLNEVAAIASHDVAMSAVLIQRANSPLHRAAAGGTAPLSTVGQAMTVLGLDETARTMTEFLARKALPVRSPQLERFWERSSRRAMAMAFIARQLPGLAVDLAHAHGLFCHVGLPVLLQCLPGYGATLMEAEMRHDRSPVATENANHRSDHAVVGALVCKLWRFSPTLVASVRLHHDLLDLGREPADTEPEVQTLVAAGLLAEQLMRQAEQLPPDRDWQDHAQQALDWLAVPADELAHWQDRLQPIFDAG
ncbi:MAG: HDOD domain-containing protein [Burkholderiaceae bacterium]|nr:HDOD domain-containing protein [Burkholderiaceae bacterium]